MLSSHAHFGYISMESRDLEYCRNDTPDFLISNLYLEGIKLNKLYVFRIHKSWSLAWKGENAG